MAEWVHIGTEEMQAAQDRVGLSNERLAPKLFIVSKTWERWKARGAVPRHQLTLVAEVLDLEVERTAPIRLALPTTNGATSVVGEAGELISTLRSEATKIVLALGQLEALLSEGGDRPAGGEPD